MGGDLNAESATKHHPLLCPEAYLLLLALKLFCRQSLCLRTARIDLYCLLGILLYNCSGWFRLWWFLHSGSNSSLLCGFLAILCRFISVIKLHIRKTLDRSLQASTITILFSLDSICGRIGHCHISSFCDFASACRDSFNDWWLIHARIDYHRG